MVWAYGIFTHDSAAGGSGNDEGKDLVLQSDGTLLIVGSSSIDSNNDFAVWKLTSAGELDTSFGGGDGIFTSDAAGALDSGTDLVILDDGTILVAGTNNGTSSSGTQGILWKVLADGSGFDISFGGGDGFFESDGAAGGTGTDTFNAMVVQADNNIVVVGTSNSGSNQDAIVIRVTSAGELDTSFGGGDGLLVFDDLPSTGSSGDNARGVALVSGGNIAVTGNSSGNVFVLRLE